MILGHGCDGSDRPAFVQNGLPVGRRRFSFPIDRGGKEGERRRGEGRGAEGGHVENVRISNMLSKNFYVKYGIMNDI